MTKKPQSESSALPSHLKGFTFFGGSLEREALPTADEDTNPFENTAFPLTQAQASDRLCIVGLKGDADTAQHLRHLGFYPGAAVQVISSSLSGSLIVTIAGKRLGLGRQMAQQVMVWNHDR